MNCLNCQAENTRDYPLCATCETSCHFTNRKDCHCNNCAALRERQALAEAAWLEEGQYMYGWPVQAAA